MRQNISWLLLLIMFLSVLVACGSANTNSSGSTAGKASASPTGSTAASSTTCTPPASGNTAYKIISNQSTASYQVQEQFLNRDLPNTAIGKTSTMNGGFLMQAGQPPVITSLKITVNLNTLQSDEQRRDNAIRQHWLESDTYPLATFVAKNVRSLPTNYSQGQTTQFSITGNMTIHNVTRQETFQVTGKMVGDSITGKGTSLLYMKNYGFDAPNIAGVLTVKDGVTTTLNFTAQKNNCDPTV